MQINAIKTFNNSKKKDYLGDITQKNLYKTHAHTDNITFSSKETTEEEIFCRKILSNWRIKKDNMEVPRFTSQEVNEMMEKFQKFNAEGSRSYILYALLTCGNNVDQSLLNSQDISNYFDVLSGKKKEEQLAVISILNIATKTTTLNNSVGRGFYLFLPLYKNPKIIKNLGILEKKLTYLENPHKDEILAKTFSAISVPHKPYLADMVKLISDKLISYPDDMNVYDAIITIADACNEKQTRRMIPLLDNKNAIEIAGNETLQNSLSYTRDEFIKKFVKKHSPKRYFGMC